MKTQFWITMFLLVVLPTVKCAYGQEYVELPLDFATSITCTAPSLSEARAGTHSLGIGSPLEVGLGRVETRTGNHTRVSRVFLSFFLAENPSIPLSAVLHLRVDHAVPDMTIHVFTWKVDGERFDKSNFGRLGADVLGSTKVDGRELTIPLSIMPKPGWVNLAILSGDDYNQVESDRLVTVESATLEVRYFDLELDPESLVMVCIAIMVFAVIVIFKHTAAEGDKKTAWDRMRDKPNWP